MRPEHVGAQIACPPTTAPVRAARLLKSLTSQKVFAEFPQMVKDDPTGDFWAPAYLLLAGPQPPTPQQIKDYLAHVRRQQGLAD